MGARTSDAPALVSACLVAARRSVELCAFDDAVRWYGDAVAHAQGLPERERGVLLASLGLARIQADDLLGGRASLREAAELLTDRDDAEELAELALSYHGPMRVTRPDPAEEFLLERALAAVGPDADPGLRSRLLAHLSAFCRDDTHPEKLAFAEQAVALARSSGDLRSVFGASRAWFWPQYGRPEGATLALDAATAALAAAERLGDVQACIEGHWLKLMAHAQLGQWPATQHDLDALGELSDRSGLRAEQGLVEAVRIRRLINTGAFVEAEERATRAFESNAPSETDLMGFGTQMIEIRRWSGRYEEALSLLDPSLFEPTPQVENLVRTARATLLAESHDADDAREEVDALAAQALASITGLGSWTHVLEVAALADISCALGDRVLGAAVTELLEPWDGLFLQVSLVADWGPACLYLGKLDSMLGRHDAAVRRLEASVDACHEAGLVTWKILSEAELSLALAARGSGEERTRSVNLAHQARDDARRLALGRVERRLARRE